jgi:hypothetical protein
MSFDDYRYVFLIIIIVVPGIIGIYFLNGASIFLNNNNTTADNTAKMLEGLGFNVPTGSLAETYTIERSPSFGSFVTTAEEHGVKIIYRSGWYFYAPVNATYAYSFADVKGMFQ